jgi:hypothetical protein
MNEKSWSCRIQGMLELPEVYATPLYDIGWGWEALYLADRSVQRKEFKVAGEFYAASFISVIGPADGLDAPLKHSGRTQIRCLLFS